MAWTEWAVMGGKPVQKISIYFNDLGSVGGVGGTFLLEYKKITGVMGVIGIKTIAKCVLMLTLRLPENESK